MLKFVDDTSIADGDEVWRHIHQEHYIYDRNRETWRPASSAFADSSDGSPMSVTLGNEATRAGVNPADCLRDRPGFVGTYGFTVGVIRELGQGVVKDPTERDPHHGLVFGRKTKSVQRQLVRRGAWKFRPDQLSPPLPA